jgi:hypothetical protein
VGQKWSQSSTGGEIAGGRKEEGEKVVKKKTEGFI